jgi:hypothetical protein
MYFNQIPEMVDILETMNNVNCPHEPPYEDLLIKMETLSKKLDKTYSFEWTLDTKVNY